MFPCISLCPCIHLVVDGSLSYRGSLEKARELSDRLRLWRISGALGDLGTS